MTPTQQQLLEDYHAGRLSPSETAAIEKEIASNPAMQAESELQGDIINGLKEIRKQELKARLESIPVTGGFLEFAQQSALVKSFGGVVVASLIGTGVYYAGVDQSKLNNQENAIVVDAPAYNSAEYVWELGQEDKDESAVELEKPQQVRVATSQAPKATNEDSHQPTELSVQEDLLDGPSEESFVPSFSAPSSVDVVSEEEFAGEEPGKIPDGASLSSSTPVDVKTNQSKGAIKYKYYDGKLFLSGDFDKAPYEILEINRPLGRDIYVYYLGNFYQVGLSDKLVELPLVKDQKLIQELEVLQLNK